VIVAVGLDIVELARIQGVWNRHRDRFLERHFHSLELDYCLSKRNALPSLAARFAAKEAFQKCWPESHGWRDVWVVREGDKPTLAFSEAITREMEARGWQAHLSLSHSREHAAAVVVMEGTG
jgi:holo-[acyl-carrier protein] synthase